MGERLFLDIALLHFLFFTLRSTAWSLLKDIKKSANGIGYIASCVDDYLLIGNLEAIDEAMC